MGPQPKVQILRVIHAFGDESYVVSDGVGIYVLGLIYLDVEDLDSAREYVRLISGRGLARFHFHDADGPGRALLVDQVKRGPWAFRVWARASVPRAQERTRRLLLNSGLHLHSREMWIFESRGHRADVRDRQLAESVIGYRSSEGIRLVHRQASDEPLLWPADVVASASAQALLHGWPAPFVRPTSS